MHSFAALLQPENKIEQDLLGYRRGCRGRVGLRVSSFWILIRTTQADVTGQRRVVCNMITKILVIIAIPLLIAGYGRHMWYEYQQGWAAAREAAELRYWEMIDLNCQLGEVTDSTKCAKALNNLAERYELPM